MSLPSNTLVRSASNLNSSVSVSGVRQNSPDPTAYHACVSSLSRDDVVHLARLARLSLSESEIDHYTTQLGSILHAVERVGEAAAEDIPPMSHPAPLRNVFREDVAVPGLTQQQALSGAPAEEDERFRVPRILDEEPS